MTGNGRKGTEKAPEMDEDSGDEGQNVGKNVEYRRGDEDDMEMEG